MNTNKILVNETELISTLRIETYQWLAQTFSHELEKEAVSLYQEGALNTIFSLFEELGLTKEVARLKQAIQDFKKLDNPCLELKADFASCFLLDEASAMPYASLYLGDDGMMYGEAERKMRELLSQSGLEILESFKEPSDHLAIYLALLQKWCEQIKRDAGTETDIASFLQSEYLAQKSFIDEGLLSWIPEWNTRLNGDTINCSSDFYPALGALLQGFLLADTAFLEHHLEDFAS
ncbi:molecular chaperone TorD [Ignatzschineria sp. LJL83]